MSRGRKVEESTLERFARATRYVEKLPVSLKGERRGPRVGGSGFTLADLADDDRRSCNEAVAINLTGRDVEPGHVMWCDSDATELDLTQLYPYATGGEAVVMHVDTEIFAADTENISLAGLGLAANDLVLLIATQSLGSNAGLQSSFKSSYDAAHSAAIVTDQSGRLPTVCAIWYDELSSGVLPLSAGTGGGGNNNRIGAIVVLRGVKRWPTNGENLTPAKAAGLIVNGLPSFCYHWNDTHLGFSSPGAMTFETSKGTSERGIVYNSAHDAIADTAVNTSYDFPKGTRFLLVHQVGDGGSGSLDIVRPSGNHPDDSDKIAEKTRVSTVRSIACYLTLPLGEPGPIDASGILAKFATEDVLSGQDDLSVIPIIPDPEEPPVFPAIPCDPLVATEYLRAVPLTANTASAKATAREALAKNRLREPVIVKETAIPHGGSGTVLRRGGYAKFWAYRRNLTDRYAGPVPENAERIDIYDSPLSGEVGKLGKFFRSPAAKLTAAIANADAGIDDIDPRVECFTGRPDLLYSSTSGPIEVLRWGRDIAEQPSAITVTVTGTKLSFSGGTVAGDWVGYELTTGADVTSGETWSVATSTYAGGVTLSQDLSIDLTQDAPGLTKPLYGLVTGGTRQTFESDGGLYRGVLIFNRWLLVQPIYSAWADAGIAVDDPQADTFTFTDDAVVFEFPDFAPFIYCDPETGEFGEVGVDVDYAAWPEEWPAPPSQVPTGTDITLVAPGFDPMLGRVPGEVEALEEDDQRLGLQLCFGYIHGWPASDGAGGCC